MYRILPNSSKQNPDKARALIVDSENNTVIIDYGGCLMFPGGKLDGGETALDAVRREVKEELGLNLGANGKKFLHFQSIAENYSERDGTITPFRLTETEYFLFNVSELKLGEQKLTEKEAIGKFAILVASLQNRELLQLIENHTTNNERWPYFKEEIKVMSRKLIEMLFENPMSGIIK